ncbi:MAG: DegT/DnrJ/EryC1/StrS family aminotransferase [Anaerolineae bacterium]|jgi:dTDP-4-amino-4,6-dideoxygalactose transaminase|nr:DegT/DnrJ/EryC1/StrS family aminotransferase [Anaerolineae bacterium]
MMTIPFNDFKDQIAAIRPALEAAMARVLDRGWFILGPEVEAFERAFADYLGGGHVIGVANGTDAIQAALMALDLPMGSEVICPALTAAPSALAIYAAGLIPVFADVDPVTYTLDPRRLAECLSERTRVILPVHLYGLMADLPAIQAFADQHNLIVIEDVAQAHGAAIHGRKAGTWTPLAAFSFYPTKNLGAYGDGGAISTPDSDLAARVRAVINLGQTGRFQHTLMGINSRLDEIQAAILALKLADLDSQNQRRQAIAQRYHDGLSDLPLQLPTAPDGYEHVYHLYVIRVPSGRDELRAHLRAAGIGTDVHYPLSLHRQGAFQSHPIASGGLAVADRLTGEILSLPMYPQLRDDQVTTVIAAIRAWYEHKAV